MSGGARTVRRIVIAALLIHTLAVLWIWSGWSPGFRTGVLVWMDFPASLLFLGAGGRRFLAWSLILGGVQWALIAALVAAAVGRLTRRTPAG
jgi:hypothetical protein